MPSNPVSTVASNRKSTSLARRLAVWSIALVVLTAVPLTGGSQARAADTTSFSFGMVGDQGADQNAQAVLTKIGSSGVDLFQNVGDLSYDQVPTPDWCALIKSRVPVPFVIVAGNHESREPDEFSAIEDYTQPGCLPNPLGTGLVESPNIDSQPMGTTNYAKEYYYDFPVGHPLARFVVLSPNENWKLNGGAAYDYSAGSVHYQWVAKAIDEAQSHGLWVIVAYHEPYVDMGGHGMDPQPSHDLFNMLVTKKVDLVINGHDHGYYRSRQFALSSGCDDIVANSFNSACVAPLGAGGQYTAGAGVVEVVSGTGGGTPHPYNPADGDRPYFVARMSAESLNWSFGFVRFDVSTTGIKGTFVDASGGGFSDSFQIVGSPKNYTPPPGPVGVVPARLLDTRVGGVTVDGLSSGGGPVGAASVVVVPVLGRGGVPGSGVAAVVVNVTGTGPSRATFLSVFPSGEGVPNASAVNLVAGETAANLAIVKVGADGQIAVFNAAGSTQVVVDVTGYYPTGAGLVGLSPQRLLDTRAGWSTIDGAGQGAGPVVGQASVEVQVTGRAGIPSSGVAAVVLNVTGIASQPCYVTAFPTGEALPNASTLNLVAGAPTPNLTVVKVGTNGMVSLYNSAGNTDLIADVAGWIPAGTSYQPILPQRLLDTRPGEHTIDGLFAGDGPVGAGQTVTVPIAGRAGIPADATAVFVNVTAVAPTQDTYVSVYPAGDSLPNASNLNPAQGAVRPNLVLAKIGTNGAITLYNAHGTTNLLIDLAGYVGAAG